MADKMYFGVPGNIQEIPYPQSGMGFDNSLDTEVTTLVSGGRAVFRSPTAYKAFKMTWTTHADRLRHIIDLYNGSFGPGPFYITDPTASQENVLPARWSNAWQLAHQASGWCKPTVVPNTIPTAVSPSTPLTNRAVQFKQATAGATVALSGVVRTRVIRLPGKPYYLSASGTATGGAGIKVRGFDNTTNAWVDISTFTTFTGSTSLVLASTNTTYTMLELDLYLPLSSTLKLVGVTLGTLDHLAMQSIVRTNLVGNPNMEGAGSATTVRTNIVTNPSSNGASTTGWTTARSTIAAVAAAITGLTQQYFRVTITDTVAGAFFQRVDMSALPVTAGNTYSLSLWMRVVGGPRVAGAQLIFLDAGSVQVGSTLSTGTVASATWAQLSVSGVAPTGATQAIVRIGLPNQTSWVTNDFFDFGAVLLEASTSVGTYFDGVTSAAGDFTFAWSGTAYNSSSLQRGTSAPGMSGSAGTGGLHQVYQTTSAPYLGAKSARLLWTSASVGGGSAGILYTQTISGGAGDVASASCWVRSSVAKSLTLLFRFRNVSTQVIAAQTAYATLAANTWTYLKVENLVSTGTYTNIQVYALVNNSVVNAVGETLDMDAVIIEPAATVGDYFDGNTVDLPDQELFYRWSGAANNSTSYQMNNQPTDWMPVGQGVGPIQFTNTLGGQLVSTVIDRIGLSVDFTEVQSVSELN